MSVYAKAYNRLLDDGKSSFRHFWDDNYDWLLAVIFLVLVAIAFSVGFCLLKRSEKKQKRMTAIEGRSDQVDSLLIRRITLVGFSVVELKKGEQFIAPVPEKDGYSFCGWFYDSACTVPYLNKRITKDTTLYPKWVKHG